MNWVQRAEAMEAACMQAVAENPDHKYYREKIEQICWESYFAWWPVRLMRVWNGRHWVPGKRRWLVKVKRHRLDREKFKDLL